jgi:hypothetical protein
MSCVVGRSGNPRGRPRKGTSVTELMAKVAVAKGSGAPICLLEELVRKLFDMAIAGDVAAARLVLAYLEGMPVARVQAEVTQMPLFNADEAAQAERMWSDYRTELLTRGAEKAGTGAA